MRKPGLRGKKAAFAKEYLVDLNATQAAIRAGYSMRHTSRGGYYVYFLCDPEDGKIFYVGKGKGERLFHHVKEARRSVLQSNGAKNQKILRILAKGLEVQEIIFADEMGESAALALERELIQLFKIHGLTNIVSGVVTAKESTMAAAEVMLARMKSFAQWEAELTTDKRRLVEKIFGGPEEIYTLVYRSLVSLTHGGDVYGAES